MRLVLVVCRSFSATIPPPPFLLIHLIFVPCFEIASEAIELVAGWVAALCGVGSLDGAGAEAHLRLMLGLAYDIAVDVDVSAVRGNDGAVAGLAATWLVLATLIRLRGVGGTDAVVRVYEAAAVALGYDDDQARRIWREYVLFAVSPESGMSSAQAGKLVDRAVGMLRPKALVPVGSLPTDAHPVRLTSRMGARVVVCVGAVFNQSVGGVVALFSVRVHSSS